MRNPHTFTLGAIRETAEPIVRAPPATVQARRAHTIEAIRARHIAVVERRNDEVADLHRRDILADGFNDPHELMADSFRFGGGGNAAVRPQIRTAHAGSNNPHDSITAGGEHRIGHLFEPNIPFTMNHSCAHGSTLFFPPCVSACVS